MSIRQSIDSIVVSTTRTFRTFHAEFMDGMLSRCQSNMNMHVKRCQGYQNRLGLENG